MSATTPGQTTPLHFTYDGAMAVQCFASDPDAEFGDTVTFVDPGDSRDQVTAKVREHLAEHGCAAQDVRPAPALAEVSAELTELTERHDDLLHAILPHGSDPCDSGDAEGTAVRNVRDLEAARDEYRDNAILHVRERDAAREVLAEVLAWLENPAVTRPGPAVIKDWRERAEMPS